jgi:hypothetical protein
LILLTLLYIPNICYSIAVDNDIKDPNAIPDYLEEVFKQKEKDKMKRKMMGDDMTIKSKIKSYEDSSNTQQVNTQQFEKKGKMENKYM